MRTETSETFERSDGAYVTRVHQRPVYRKVGNAFEKIDASLVSAGGALEPRAAGAPVRLPLQAGGVGRVGDDRYWIELSLQDASGAATTSGSKATYASALPSVSRVLDAQVDGVKESLILDSKAAQSEYRYSVDLAPGLTLIARSDGGLRVADAEGVTRFSIAPPVVWDAAGGPDRPLAKASYRLEGSTLVLSVDRAWLDAATRAFPVTVDPTITTGANRACTITSPSTGACSSTTLKVGSDTGGAVNRALLNFDLDALGSPTLPRYALIHDARVQLYDRAEASTTSTDVRSYRLTRGPFSTAATWGQYAAGQNWTTAGGDFDSTYDEHNVVYTSDLGSTQSIGVAPSVQRWLRDGPTKNFGVMLGAASNTPGNVKTFDSPTGAVAPVLEITWQPRLGTTSDMTFRSYGVDDRSQIKVNMANGNLALTSQDLKIAGVGQDATVTRIYNSMGDLGTGSVGKGWRLSAGTDVRLTESGYDSSYIFAAPDGSRWRFDQQPDGSYSSPAPLGATLTINAGGTRTLKFAQSNSRMEFDAATPARLTSVIDRSGNHIDFGYDASGWKTMTDTYGDVVNVANDGGGVDFITDYDARVSNYVRNSTTGNLDSYVDATGKTTSYGYDSGGLLTSVTDARGNQITMIYDTRGRVTSLTRVVDGTTTNDETTTFDYGIPGPTDNPCSGVSGVEFTQRVTVTDGRNNVTVYCSDSTTRVQKAKDAVGRLSTTGFDSVNGAGNTFTGFAGTASASTTNLTYNFYAGQDSIGYVTQVDEGAGERSTTVTQQQADCTSAGATACPDFNAWKYQPKSTTSSTGAQQLFGYDPKGRVTDIKDSATPKNQAHLTYNAQGQVTSAYSGDSGRTTNYTYTANELTSITPPTGTIGATTMTYDALHRVATVTDARNQRQTMTYDKEDRVTKIKVEDVSGAAVLKTTFDYTFDANGNQTQRVETRVSPAVTNTTTYVYDKLNRLLTETFPSAKTNTYTYDKNSNLRSITDATGTVTYGRDSADRVLKITNPDATAIDYAYNDTSNPRTKTKYFTGGLTQVDSFDLSGKLLDSKLKNGATVVHGFAKHYPAGAGTGTTKALPNTITDLPSNNVATLLYDQDDQLEKYTIKTSGGSTLYDWDPTLDAASNRTQLTKTGASTTYMATNNANQLCRTQTTSSPTCPAGAPGTWSTYTYDPAGNQTASSTGFSAGYDALSRLTTLNTTALDYLSPTNGELVTAGSTALQNNVLGLSRDGTIAYTRDPDDGSVVAQRGATTQFFFTDQTGSTTDLFTGTTVGRTYSYDPDGNQRTTTGAAANTNIRYAGGHLINGLYHFGARYYDPTTARWTQTDPIDQTSDLRQANRYTYAGADPVNLVDPQGLSSGYVNPCSVGPRSSCPRGTGISKGAARVICAGVVGGASAAAGVAITAVVPGAGASAGLVAFGAIFGAGSQACGELIK